jgi:hypothetical protein
VAAIGRWVDKAVAPVRAVATPPRASSAVISPCSHRTRFRGRETGTPDERRAAAFLVARFDGLRGVAVVFFTNGLHADYHRVSD